MRRAVGHATVCGTPDDIIMKAIGQEAGAEANGNVVSHAAMGLVAGASGRIGVALIALRVPLMALANADMASQGLVGRAGAGGMGGGGGAGSIQSNGLKGLNWGVGGGGAGGAMGTGQFHNCDDGCGLAAGACNTADQKFST